MVLAKPLSFATVRAEADPMIVLRRPTLDDRLQRRG
jgi:hypothetical protein